MGHSRKLFADSGGLTEHDVSQLAGDGLAPPPTSSGAPIHGTVMRHGQPIGFTLDTEKLACERPRLFPEHIVIAAVVLASFVGPIWHLLG